METQSEINKEYSELCIKLGHQISQIHFKEQELRLLETEHEGEKLKLTILNEKVKSLQKSAENKKDEQTKA